MTISQPYIRALIANLIVLSAFVAWAFYMEGGPQGKYHAASIGALEIGSVVGLIVTLLIGTLLWIGRKSWPWWFVGFVTMGCWLVILLIGMMLMPHSGDLMRVAP
jgi:hypothetical protein